MGRRLKGMLSSINWRHVLSAIVTLASLGLIVWAGVAVWQRPCREGAVISLMLSPAEVLVSSPTCPSLLMDLEPLLVALGFWPTHHTTRPVAQKPSATSKGSRSMSKDGHVGL
ncbi:MAG: hypothetical protein J7M17_03050, partial [Anaerolineae bacterium]|nr:hypothetical protein [Anaerolineae bacterium]